MYFILILHFYKNNNSMGGSWETDNPFIFENILALPFLFDDTQCSRLISFLSTLVITSVQNQLFF